MTYTTLISTEELAENLENPNFLKIIAKNGQQKALDQHNWDFRLFNTFSSLGLIK